MSAAIRPEDVAKYLKDHPEFFDEYADLLASIQVPHPYGGHAIPLSERQVLALRERSRSLEGKLRELVQFGEENDTVSDKVHRFSVALLAVGDLPALVNTVETSLREDFDVPAVALRIWADPYHVANAGAQPVSEEVQVFTESLAAPYFSDVPLYETAGWFDSPGPEIKSLVYMPLSSGRVFGVLALGSADPARFTRDMGTLYVGRIADLVSAALGRYLRL